MTRQRGSHRAGHSTDTWILKTQTSELLHLEVQQRIKPHFFQVEQKPMSTRITRSYYCSTDVLELER